MKPAAALVAPFTSPFRVVRSLEITLDGHPGSLAFFSKYSNLARFTYR
jgi:hypothetical protein